MDILFVLVGQLAGGKAGSEPQVLQPVADSGLAGADELVEEVGKLCVGAVVLFEEVDKLCAEVDKLQAL